MVVLCIYDQYYHFSGASLEAIEVREKNRHIINIYTSICINRTNDLHTHTEAQLELGMMLAHCLQPDILGMPETNFGHHMVPVGLIIVCIRSQFVL